MERLSSHRPIDVNGLVAQVRAVAAAFPHRASAGWPSYCAKAYIKESGDPDQLRFVVVAQWCPYRCRPVLWVARSRVFGGSSSPLNLSRHPAWSCEAQSDEGGVKRYAMGKIGDSGSYVDIVKDPDTPQGTWTFGEGIIHHCAFDIDSLKSQIELSLIKL